MMEVGTKVVSPSGTLGTIRNVQEGGGVFARGYYVYFEDLGHNLFLPEHCVEPYIEYEEEGKQIAFKL